MAATDTPHYRIKAALVALLKALGLTEINDRVFGQVYPDPLPSTLPAVFCTTEGEPEEIGDGTTEHRDVGYPVRVFFADRDTSHRHEREPIYLEWRRRVLTAVDMQEGIWRTLVPGVNRIETRPRAVFDPEGPQYQYVVGSIVFVFWFRSGK
jgi:hypothetical protein